MKLRLISSIAIVGLLISFKLSGEELQLIPEDEAERDVSLMEFRQKVMEIIRGKDAEGLQYVLDDRVSTSSNKRSTKQKFNSIWKPEAIDSELWHTLDTILNMGGGFVRSERGVKFCAPYIFTNFPVELDIYGHGAVIQENVELKAAASRKSQTLTQLSYNVVKVEDWRSVVDATGGNTRWLKVRTLAGKEGYVDKRTIRSPSDYSVCFLNRPTEGWKIISLIGNE